MTSSYAELHSYLRLRLVTKLANNIKIKLLVAYGLEGLTTLTDRQLSSIGLNHSQRQALLHPDETAIKQILSTAQQYQMTLVGYLDSRYPDSLKHIENAPILLFVQGNVGLLNQQQLAIVGSRSATLSARKHCQQFANVLCQYCVITSGLAIGIDAAAHLGTLDNHGYTIAVVATGLDSVYPARHKPLAQRILANNGAIVSENLPMSKPHPGAFPRRNRIITGMSVGVFVIEARLKSGSLISAHLALEQNREVFAMPGAISNEQTRGCHYLIKQGANLVEHSDDIISTLDLCLLPQRINNKAQELAQNSQKKLTKNTDKDLFHDALLSSVDYEAVTTVDTIVSRSKLSIEEVLTRLMALELRGLVAAVPGGYIKLANKAID